MALLINGVVSRTLIVRNTTSVNNQITPISFDDVVITFGAPGTVSFRLDINGGPSGDTMFLQCP